ncbi:hypothetical protein [Streptomyces sp. NPDC000878]
MHETPPGRPHGPEPDAGPDDALVGELRELMERAAAGLAPLPDLTQEAVRLGGRRRIRARLAVVGAVAGVLAAGGIGSAALGGLGSAASQPVGPAVAPPTATRPPAVPTPVPAPSMPMPMPASATPSVSVPTGTTEALGRAEVAAALTVALGDLIGTVSPDGVDLFAGRIDGHTFPVTFQVIQGADALGECPDPPDQAVTCRTAWLSGRIEARLLVTGADLPGGESLGISYRYLESTVKLTVGSDTDAGVSPPVTADQLVVAAGSEAMLAAVKYELKYAARYAEKAEANSSGEASGSPSFPAPDATTEPSTAEPSLAGDPNDTDSASETGGSSR